jgi:hypothetical protein
MDARPFVNLLSGKMRVTFINATTGKLIGIQKMKPDQLPASFDRPTIIEFNGKEWRVMKAVPIHAKEFRVDNKLTLHVEESQILNQNIGNYYPTICKGLPASSKFTIFNDFQLEIPADKWRQYQFLPPSLLNAAQEEIEQIIQILFPESNRNNLHGYFDVHVRKNIKNEPLNFPLDSFCERMNIREKGGVLITQGEFLKDGFALRSDNYIYYGTVVENKIEELNLESFESADEEFFEVATIYELLLADWCNAKLIMV